MLEPDAAITCVDCGGVARLTTFPPEAEGGEERRDWVPGEMLTYLCIECGERFDVVFEDTAVEDDPEDL